jgi:RNA polymerase sigma-70 factor (ECF subfamily)
MPEVTCWTLISGAASGNDVDRREFASRYLPVVRAYLHARWRGRLDAHELEDVEQEVFVECLREGGVLQRAERGHGEGFRAFLFGVVRNVAQRCEARRARRLDEPGSATFHGEDLESGEPSLSRVFDHAWARAILRQALGRMESTATELGGSRSRRVELLDSRFGKGRSIHDIARAWGVEPGYLHHEFRRALRDFEDALKEVVAFHHPGEPEAVARECRELLALAR